MAWSEDGVLDQSWERLPTGDVVGVLARRGPDGQDEIRVGRVPEEARVVGDFAPLDYTAIDHIPVLADPHRLPPHAGTAVLNLLATLAADAAADALPYRGPYPTEALFLALLESFRYTPETRDPLAAFVSGTLRWRPAPHTRTFTPEAYIQRRGRVEKVVWQRRGYYRPDWQGVVRHAPRRVHDDAGVTYCGLWALGRPLETHLAIDGNGSTRVLPLPPASSDVAPLGATVAVGVASVVIAQSAPALASAVRDVSRDLRLEWGPVEGDLVSDIHGGFRLSAHLRAAAAEAMRAADDRPRRVGLGLAVLTEIAALVGDGLRRRAQEHLARLDPDAQRRALQQPSEGPSAPAIAAAADALAARLADALT